MTRILICGGRDYRDAQEFSEVMGSVAKDPTQVTEIITGCASGADHLARGYAAGWQIDLRVFAAQWRQHGNKAGPMRNQRMLDLGRPDLCVAFPGGRGTADMVRRAKAAGVPVVEVART